MPSNINLSLLFPIQHLIDDDDGDDEGYRGRKNGAVKGKQKLATTTIVISNDEILAIDKYLRLLIKQTSNSNNY
jgi:hypothetical protein